MANKEFDARIKNKRDTSANWESKNPVILDGEIIFVDTNAGELRAKIGDGTKTYTQLPFSDEVLRNLIGGKVDKIDGMGLSSNDYTATEKTKLAGVAEGANNYTLPVATDSSIGGIKSGSDIIVDSLGNVTVNGGNAATANKLNTNAGDSNTPVYFSNGVPVACTGLDLDTTGNAATATQLATARTIRTKLSSTSTASFNGSANITPGVTGTLAISNGGTGATTAAAALTNLGAQAALGFTPVQQGGGTNQLSNKIYIGWTGDQLTAQVDVSNFGAIILKDKHLVKKMLWSGGWLMGASHVATLSEKISDQLNGIIIQFTVNNAIAGAGDRNNYWYQPSFFISKHHLDTIFTSTGTIANTSPDFIFTMFGAGFAKVAQKRLYITDSKITGCADNIASGTSNGITYTNNTYMLTAVYGV